MIWDILEKKITDAGLGIAGQTLFRHSMPAEVSRGIMFKNPLVGIVVDPHIPGFHKPDLQCIIRHPDVYEGDTLAEQVQALLTIAGPESYPATAERGAVTLKIFEPKTLPIQYPRLKGNGIEWSLNFITAFNILPL